MDEESFRRFMKRDNKSESTIREASFIGVLLANI